MYSKRVSRRTEFSARGYLCNREECTQDGQETRRAAVTMGCCWALQHSGVSRSRLLSLPWTSHLRQASWIRKAADSLVVSASSAHPGRRVSGCNIVATAKLIRVLLPPTQSQHEPVGHSALALLHPPCVDQSADNLHQFCSRYLILQQIIVHAPGCSRELRFLPCVAGQH